MFSGVKQNVHWEKMGFKKIKMPFKLHQPYKVLNVY